MSLGKKIKERRKFKKLTQKDLADKIEVDHTTISKWESDTYEPDTKSLKKLAFELDCSTDYLLELVDDPDSYNNKEEFISVVKEKGLNYNGLSEEEIKWFNEMLKKYKDNKKRE